MTSQHSDDMELAVVDELREIAQVVIPRAEIVANLKVPTAHEDGQVVAVDAALDAQKDAVGVVRLEAEYELVDAR